MSSYDSYWGKARPTDSQGPSYHPLAHHCLDVAAVGVAYLRRTRSLRQLFKESLGIDAEVDLERWMAFWLAMHDLGKFSESFQGQRPDLYAMLRGRSPDAEKPYVERHDSLGMWVWTGMLFDVACDREWFGPNTEDRIDALDWWARAVTGHHGQPPRSASGAYWGKHFDPSQDRTAICDFVADLHQLFLETTGPAVGHALTIDGFTEISRQLSWWTAGLTVLADWLGSNTDHFPYRGAAESVLPIHDYWPAALAQAEGALNAAGMSPVPGGPTLAFNDLFPSIPDPSPLQNWSANARLPNGPQIYLLEDVTGAGKTEAAVLLAQRLMASGQADGFFIGLPTMATANAMYGRIAGVYTRLFDGQASLALAHGNRHLVEKFAESIVPPGPDLTDSAQTDETATARCTAWLADHNKRALLAPAGVGTIDQALLAVLHSKHQSLRLLGLFRKVLVVDEVHACDPYMQTVLESLLEFHALAGGSAILLSATLPGRMKQALLGAFARGRRQPPAAISAADFPLVTGWQSALPATLLEQPIATRDDVRRRVSVRHLDDETMLVEDILAALAAGHCVCWMRNTVADALAAFALFHDRIPAERLTLFHARFCLQDRLRIENDVLEHFGPTSTPAQRSGRLVIATQVAEQSLDADWDLVVSDLAPIDRIIQRAGRLRRHPRSADGQRLPDPQARDQRGEPYLWVFGPAWSDDPPANWFKAALPKSAAVYPHHGHLWHSARVLRRGHFVMPDDARALIEGVFGDEATPPRGLQGNANKAEGQDWADISSARQNVVRLSDGYVRGGVVDWWREAATPSRLGEATTAVLLARWDGDRIVPWAEHENPRHAWAYSSVRVAERLIARRVAESDPRRERAIQEIELALPGKGKWSVLLIMESTPSGWTGSALATGGDSEVGKSSRWVYDQQSGLRQHEPVFMEEGE